MNFAAVGATIGLAHLAARRVRADRTFLLAVWLVLLAATTLVAAAFQYTDTVAIRSLRGALIDASPTDRGISVQTAATPDQVAGFDQSVSGILTGAFGPVAPVYLAARSSSLAPAGLPSDQAATHLTVLGGYAGLEDHANLTAGRWPIAGRSPVEATLSVPAAKALGLGLGDTLSLVDASVPGATTPLLTVVVTGTWSADPGDPYWLGDPLDLHGSVDQGSLASQGPFMVEPADLLTRGLIPHLDLTWRAGVALDQVVPADLPGLIQALPGLSPSISAALPARQAVSVSTGLGPVLAAVQQSLDLARGGVALLVLQFVVLAAFAVILVAALLSERRRRENRLLESRGATRAETIVVSTAEAILVTVPAVVLALPAAAFGVRLLLSVGPLAGQGIEVPVTISSTAITAAVATGLVAAAALIAPSLSVGGRFATLRLGIGREGSKVTGQRFGIDLALLFVAGLALWQLRQAGSPAGGSGSGQGISPILVIGPAVGLAACSLLATRALPRLARLFERAVANRRALTLQLGARDLARRPLRSIRSTLLVMLAVGLTTFALVYDATWFGSQADQAAYQSAADIRVVTPAYPKVAPPLLGSAYRGLDGVTAASPVINGTIDVGGSLRSATVLGVDTVSVPDQVNLPGGPNGPLAGAFQELAGARPSANATTLPGTPRRLAVTLDAALTTLSTSAFGGQAGEPVESPAGITVSAVILDADGGAWRFNASTDGGFNGLGQQLVIPLDQSGLAGGTASTQGGDQGLHLAAPLKLEALEINLLATRVDATTSGTLDVRTVQASDDPTGGAWTAVPFNAGQPGWGWQRVDPDSTIVPELTTGPSPYLPPAGQPNRIAVGTSDSGVINGSFENDGTLFRASASGPGPLVAGAIAGTSYLAATQQHVGDTFTASVAGNPVDIQIVAETEAMPPLDPAKPFLIVDGPTLSLAEYFNDGQAIQATEWWLTVQPGSAAAVTTSLAAAPFSATTIVSHEALLAAREGDPVALGVVGALLLGAISAILFAALGFLISASASIESRSDEFGLLRALGLADRQLLGWLALEQALLLAIGIGVGIVLGIAFAGIVLPAIDFTPTGQAPVPAASLVVPWPALAAMALGGLVLLIATIVVATRVIGRISVAATLRAVVE